MKRKILIAIYIFLILIMLKLIYNTVANSILISKYNNGEYSEKQAKALTFLNFPQSYVANYNYGNILYQNEKYESAIAEYKKALDDNPPKDKECNIRINYALAICKNIQVDENDQNSIQNAINEYETAINILTQNGCANKNDNNGHSQKAEKLKQDIQNEINRLKKMQQDQANNTNNNENDENKNKPQNIEEQIQKLKEEAIQEQRNKESEFEKFNKNYNSTGKNW